MKRIIKLQIPQEGNVELDTKRYLTTDEIIEKLNQGDSYVYNEMQNAVADYTTSEVYARMQASEASYRREQEVRTGSSHIFDQGVNKWINSKTVTQNEDNSQADPNYKDKLLEASPNNNIDEDVLMPTIHLKLHKYVTDIHKFLTIDDGVFVSLKMDSEDKIKSFHKTLRKIGDFQLTIDELVKQQILYGTSILFVGEKDKPILEKTSYKDVKTPYLQVISPLHSVGFIVGNKPIEYDEIDFVINFENMNNFISKTETQGVSTSYEIYTRDTKYFINQSNPIQPEEPDNVNEEESEIDWTPYVNVVEKYEYEIVYDKPPFLFLQDNSFSDVFFFNYKKLIDLYEKIINANIRDSLNWEEIWIMISGIQTNGANFEEERNNILQAIKSRIVLAPSEAKIDSQKAELPTEFKQWILEWILKLLNQQTYLINLDELNQLQNANNKAVNLNFIQPMALIKEREKYIDRFMNNLYQWFVLYHNSTEKGEGASIDFYEDVEDVSITYLRSYNRDDAQLADIISKLSATNSFTKEEIRLLTQQWGFNPSLNQDELEQLEKEQLQANNMMNGNGGNDPQGSNEENGNQEEKPNNNDKDKEGS